MRVKWITLLTLSLFLSMATLGPGLSSEAWAKRDKRKTVSTWTYKRLSEVQDDLAKERFTSALTRLEALSSKSRLNTHELALVWQMYGFTYSMQGRYADAASSFEKCLAQNSLPESTTLHTRYNLAQAYLGSEAFAKAINELNTWLAATPTPTAEVYYLLAAAHVQLKDFKGALPYARKAVSMKSKPREPWLNLLMSVHFELNQLKSVLGVCKRLVGLYPKRSYWLQLASVYNELGDTRRALATLELSYAQGFVTRSNEIVSLVSLYLDQGIPYKAAEILEKEISAGRVESNLNNMKMLSSAWLQSRERERALVPLNKAAQLDVTGESAFLLAQVYVESENWKLAHQSAERALKKANLKRPGQVHLLSGIALLSMKQNTRARKAFQRAEQFTDDREAARQWLNHLKDQSP